MLGGHHRSLAARLLLAAREHARAHLCFAHDPFPAAAASSGAGANAVSNCPVGVGASAVGMMADNIGLARALATQVFPLLAGVLAVGGYALLNVRGAPR